VGVISSRISVCYFPLPLVPSRRGRGKFTFYETINIGTSYFSNIPNVKDSFSPFVSLLTKFLYVYLDASVILKWYLTDKTYGQKALDLLYSYIAKELNILSPSLLEYEVINGLLIAQRRGRVKEEKILTAIEGFFDLEIELKDLSHFYPKELHYCNVYHRSVYNASYLALAEVGGVSLITGDEGLYRAVKSDLKWVKWLGDV